jgi:hypothetical protein
MMLHEKVKKYINILIRKLYEKCHVKAPDICWLADNIESGPKGFVTVLVIFSCGVVQSV